MSKKEFTGYYDKRGKKIYIGDYLKHHFDEVEGVVVKINNDYFFGGCFELEHYGADVEIVSRKNDENR